MPTDVCFVVGARPNFMKAAPVLRALDAGVARLLVHTEQHYDAEMSDVFVRDLDLPAPDVTLGVGSGSHAEQTGRALARVAAVLEQHRPALVVVAGDVNSTLAGALAAVQLGIPVAHIESGLRSYDGRMPEEHNRRLTDHASTILLAHSHSAVDNLTREGIDPGRIHLVGNTMIDSLGTHLERARARRPWERYGLAPGGYGVVTLHRPTLVDDPQLLGEVMHALVALAERWPLVFPVHPRTARRLDADGLERLAHPRSALRLVPALGYLEFLGLEAGARFVLTDSGGVQEESSALGVACFTLRDTTERPVTVELGTNVVLGAGVERIAELPELLDRPRPAGTIPLWDGQAGQRAARVLEGFLSGLAARMQPVG